MPNATRSKPLPRQNFKITRDPQCFAAAWASRLQPTTNLAHQVSYGQHVTPQMSCRGLRQRNAIVWCRSVSAIGLGTRKPRSAIASCALTISPTSWCSSCRSCIISNEAWGGPIPRRFRAHPLAAQEQQAPKIGQDHGAQQPTHYGSIPRHCRSSRFQTID
jgi:hypothetical protein